MEKRIAEILKEICNKSNVDYMKCNLIEDGILESLVLMQLLVSLEEEFQIDIDIDDVDEDNFSTVAEIANLVKKLQK